MSAQILPNNDSTTTASTSDAELFRFRNPVLLRSQRGTVTYIRSHQIQRRERIFLNIYHLHKCLNTRCFSCCCMGVYHSGVELFGTEIAFGGSSNDSTGIFLCSPMHTVSPRHFGEEFELLSSTCVGYTKMTPIHLTKLIDLMSPEWPGNSYNLISRNCNHFVEVFLAQIACQYQPPRFINRCSRLAVSVKCCLPRIITDMNFDSPANFYRFSGRGMICRVNAHGRHQRQPGLDNIPIDDSETASKSAASAAGDAALSRHLNFIRSQHSVHPSDYKPIRRIRQEPILPPKSSNSMHSDQVSNYTDAYVVQQGSSENCGSVHMGAMLPADIDAINVIMSGSRVDVSSDESLDDGSHHSDSLDTQTSKWPNSTAISEQLQIENSESRV